MMYSNGAIVSFHVPAVSEHTCLFQDAKPSERKIFPHQKKIDRDTNLSKKRRKCLQEIEHSSHHFDACYTVGDMTLEYAND